MKIKILYLFIGILLGSIVTTGIFTVINKNNKKNMPQRFFNGENFDPSNRPQYGTGTGDPSKRTDIPDDAVIHFNDDSELPPEGKD